MHGLESLIVDCACDAAVSWDVAKSEFAGQSKLPDYTAGRTLKVENKPRLQFCELDFTWTALVKSLQFSKYVPKLKDFGSLKRPLSNKFRRNNKIRR